MKRFLFFASAIAMLFLHGCSTGTNNGPVTPENDANSDPDVLPPNQVLIRAIAPEGFTGDFGFGDGDALWGQTEVFCKETTSCEAIYVDFTVSPRIPCKADDALAGKCEDGFWLNVEEWLAVEFYCPGHMFVPMKVFYGTEPEKTQYEVHWDFPGAWGLAPNGMYVDQNGEDYQVETEIEYEDGKPYVALVIHGFSAAVPVEENKLVRDGKSFGVISDDLKSFTFDVPDDEIWTFTFVE